MWKATNKAIIRYFFLLLIHKNIFFQTSGEKGVSAFPEGENLFKWVATINGPVGTVSTDVVLLSVYMQYHSKYINMGNNSVIIQFNR